MEEIVNRVAESKLEVFDLEDYYPEGTRSHIDMAQWLEEGMLLREKDFGTALQNYNWNQYQDNYVSISCSSGAIIPAWASILVAVYLAPFAKLIVAGNSEAIDTMLYREILPKLDFSLYLNKPVIIKGCARKPVPANAYLLAAQLLQPVAKSIMYGEACSAVPLFKRK